MAEEQELVKEEEVKAPKVEEKVLEPETEEASDKLEIEVSDDTPVEDQNRKNLPKELVNRLESDELTDYDAEVKDKIYQLKKVWHDERREKERVQRENEEAIRTTQKLIEENKKLKERYGADQEVYKKTLLSNADLEIDAAKKAYKTAYDDGDPEKIVEAQQMLSEATIKKEKANSYITPLQNKENSVQQELKANPTALPPDAKAIKWQNDNTWFGQDEEMTSLALGLHEKLVKQHGSTYATTDEYYTRINETMRKRFPEYFDTKDGLEKEEKTTKPSTVVAPVTRTTSSKKIRLSTSQVNLAKKLGLTPEQYAKEMIRLENKNA